MGTTTDIVRDQHGHLVAGATVTIRSHDGELIDQITTNEAGEWSSLLPAAAYALTIQKGRSVISRTLIVCIAGSDFPFNVVAPVASGGPLVGQTLSCTSGTWSGPGSFSYAYQWRRNGTPISLATASTYLLVTADDGASIDCVVTATSAFGATPRDSNNIAAGTVPAFTAAPVVTGGPLVGATLTSTAGSGTGTATVTPSYQWRRNGTPIGGATASTYILVTADASTNVDCLVTATNSFGNASQDSNDIAVGSADYLTNLWCWYDASQLVGLANNDPVTTWPDLAGNSVAHDLTTHGGSTNPLFKTGQLNGLPGIKFDGSDDILARNFGGGAGDEAGYKSGTEHTIFVVAKAVPAPSGGAGSDNPILNAGTGGGSASYRYLRSYTNSGTSKVNLGRDGGAGFDLIVLITPGENLLIAGRYSATAGNALLRLNGDGSRQATGTSQSDTSSSGIALATGIAATGATSAGTLCEIRIYTGDIGNTNIATVEAFLKAKWGL